MAETATTTTVDDIPSFADLATSIDSAAAKGSSVEIKPSSLMGKPATPMPEPAKEQPKEQAKEAPKQPEKVEAKTEDGDDHTKLPEYKSANAKLRAVLDKVAKERNEFKTKAGEAESIKAKISEYEAKIKALESKPVETKADTALIEKYEKEIAAREQRIRELDYAKSTDFTERFVKPLQKTYKQAIDEVTQLTVTDGETNRQATQADFDTVRSLPLAQRRAAARQMFGDDANFVLDHIRDIEKLQREGNEAIESEKLNGETRRKEEAIKSEREKEEYVKLLKTFEDEITNEYASLFKPGEDEKDAAEALRAGFEFVDTALNKTGAMTMKERAAYNAVLRAKAAAFPVQNLKIEKLTAERNSLLEELKKFRASDPGSGGKTATPERKEEEEISLKSFAAKFNELD